MATTPELIINGDESAASSWGLRMGEGFLDTLTAPLSTKDPVENESRIGHGKRVVVDAAAIRFKSRELTLNFTIEGKDEAEFRERKRMFLEAVYRVKISLQVPALGTEVYRLIYKGAGMEYGMNRARTFCHLTLKFEEPDPTDRGAL